MYVEHGSKMMCVTKTFTDPVICFRSRLLLLFNTVHFSFIYELILLCLAAVCQFELKS